MKRNAPVIVLAGIVVAVAAWELVPASTHAPTKPSHPAPAATTAPSNPSAGSMPAGTAGYVVHFDKSGNIVAETSPAAQAEFNAELNQTVSTSQEGLTEKPSPVAGGGTMMNLQGRFQPAATATVDKDGKLHVPCLTNEADVHAFTSATAADRAAKKK